MLVLTKNLANPARPGLRGDCKLSLLLITMLPTTELDARVMKRLLETALQQQGQKVVIKWSPHGLGRFLGVAKQLQSDDATRLVWCQSLDAATNILRQCFSGIFITHCSTQ